MKARWLAGYCTWNPGMGYKFADVPGHGKMIVPDEPRSPAGKVSPAKIHTMLRRELYAGYLSVKSAGIHMLIGMLAV